MSLKYFRQRLRRLLKRTTYPIGHFYSALPDREEAEIAVDLADSRRHEIPAGIQLDDGAMQSLWAELVPLMSEAPFPVSQNSKQRFYYDNPFYSYGDALVLHALLRLKQPDTFVEVGSGFSTAAVLDTREMFGCPARITCIEPYPNRLKSLLKPVDMESTLVLEQKVQETDMSVFSELGTGDFLFIDSSHVMKTGSDLNFVMHEVLPRLAEGVIVHFHDIFWPFEYPREWVVEQNRGWNELYAIRNFLMYNDVFEILFFNHYFGQTHPEAVQSGSPLFARNPGGGLWLKKRGG